VILKAINRHIYFAVIYAII